jgi:hypothetical protein
MLLFATKSYHLGRLGSDGAALSSNVSLRWRIEKYFRLIQHTAHSANIPTDGGKFPPRPRRTETVHPPFLSTISQLPRPPAVFGALIALFTVVGRWDQ